MANVYICLKRVVLCYKLIIDYGSRCKMEKALWCLASFTHCRPVSPQLSMCSNCFPLGPVLLAYPSPPPPPRKIDLDGRLVTHEPWWSLSSLISVPLAVRRGSSDPHEGAARVRRGAGRRHPHGLQRFQLPALRPLLVRDQQREQPVIALAGCQRDISHQRFCHVCCEDRGSVQPCRCRECWIC